MSRVRAAFLLIGRVDFAAERTGTGAYSSYSGAATDGDDDNKSNKT